MAPSEVATEARRRRSALSSGAENRAVARVASCDALVVAGVRQGGRGFGDPRLFFDAPLVESGRLRLSLGRPWGRKP